MFTATITNNSILLVQRCTIRRDICIDIRSLFNGKNVSGLAYHVYVIVVLVNTRIITSQQLFFARPCGLYRRLLFGESRNVHVMVSKATTIAVQNTRIYVQTLLRRSISIAEKWRTYINISHRRFYNKNIRLKL